MSLYEFVRFLRVRTLIKADLSTSTEPTNRMFVDALLENCIKAGGYHLNGLDKPVFMEVPRRSL